MKHRLRTAKYLKKIQSVHLRLESVLRLPIQLAQEVHAKFSRKQLRHE